MEKKSLIALDEFCALHNIEVSFVSSLSQNGLISITTIQESGYIENGQLQQLEKFIRLYYELDINLEGIETITYLLQRITNQQDEITALRNRLRIYEKK